MRLRHLAISLLLTIPVFAAGLFDRGTVFTETNRALWLWQQPWQYAVGTGTPLIYELVPYASNEGQFFVPAPNQVLFHHRGTMVAWDGVPRLFASGETGQIPLFHEDGVLTEIAPMRSGNFLVGGDKLIQFNLRGKVAEYALPEHAEHIELLADQCTVLYSAGRAVRRYDLCTRESGLDFAMTVFETPAGSIRALPNGDVLVANDPVVLRFSPSGTLRTMYDAPGVTHLALTQDCSGFVASGAIDGKAFLRRFDPAGIVAAQEVPLGNPEMQSLPLPEQVGDLVVAGECRVSTPPPPTRFRSVRR